jgi:hypothetical protein
MLAWCIAAPAPASGGYGQEDAPGCSIFVKDLPADITAEKLAEVWFSSCGSLNFHRNVSLECPAAGLALP